MRGELEAASPIVTYGWGMIPVTAQIGTTEWITSLLPKDGRYIVPVKTDPAACSAFWHPGEPAEVMRVDIQRNARTRQLIEHSQNVSGRGSEYLETRRSLKRLRVCLPDALTDETHVVFQGGRVWMDLDDCYLAKKLIHVLVERDEPRLIRFDEA
jgi:hypothetical protein